MTIAFHRREKKKKVIDIEIRIQEEFSSTILLSEQSLLALEHVRKTRRTQRARKECLKHD